MYIEITIKARVKIQDPTPIQTTWQYLMNEEIEEALETFKEDLDDCNFLPVEGGSELIDLNASWEYES